MGVCVPEELGGAGADFLSYILVLEELSRADAGVGVTVAVHTSAVTLPIVAFGTDEQKRAVRAAARTRCRSRGVRAHRARGSGSDAGALRTSRRRRRRAVADRGLEAVDHERQLRGHLPRLRAHRPGDHRARGVSAFLLDGTDVEVTREEEKLGLHSSSTADIRVDGATVGPDRLLHELHRGFTVAMHTLDGGRIGIAAQAVGIAQAAYDAARAYALERRQFGTRIADFQAIQFKLADMATEIDAARMLTYRAAWLKQAGLPHTAEGAKAKLFASGVARRQTAEAIQVLGGYGYTPRVPGRALLPRRKDHRDLRGHERDPAHRDRPQHPRAARGACRPARVTWTRCRAQPTSRSA